eukprot:tig00001415_g8681.t1
MPKSRRNLKVSLTQTEKKGRERKEDLVERIRACIEEFSNIWVFSFENMRNAKLKEVRDRLKPSRFFLGKNKVMQLALGKSEEDEQRTGLSELGKRVTGQCGLFFTNMSKEEVLKFTEEYKDEDFARAGFVATEDVVFNEGPLENQPGSLEPYLRKLGMPTLLKNGVIQLLGDYTVCTKGQALNPEQAKLLKTFGVKMSEFRLVPVCMWSSADSSIESFREPGEGGDADGEEIAEDDD